MRKVIVSLLAILLVLAFSDKIHAATVMEKCNAETTGLKYTEIGGSGLASAFFIIPLLALAPVAWATDTTGQYRCHVSVIGRDAVKFKLKGKHPAPQ